MSQTSRVGAIVPIPGRPLGSRACALTLVVTVLGAPGPASAAVVAPPSASADVVELKNGGMVRGTIEEIVPGVSVIITPALGGPARTITWGEVAKVRRQGESTTVEPAASEPTPSEPTPSEPTASPPTDRGPGPAVPVEAPPPPVAAPEAPAADETTPGPGQPRIHIDVTRPTPVTLAELTGEFSASRVATRSVCDAPCDTIVDGRSGNSFFFRGPGFKSSKFTLVGYDRDVVARVKPGRTGLLATGIVLVSLSGLSGLSALLVPGHPGAPYDANLRQRKFHDWNYTPMAVVIGTGAVALIAGAIMIASGVTRYKLTWERPSARRRGVHGRG